MVFDVDLLPCAWLQMDDAARVGQHNALLAARLGRPGQRLLGQALAGWLTPASRLVFEATLMPALRSGEPIDGTTLSFCTAVGDWAVLAHFRPAHAAGKTLISAIFTSAQEQLRMHEALRHARQSLDTMPGAVLQCRRGAGGGLSFPYASAKLLDLTGVAPAALAADAQGLLDALLPDDRQRFESTLAEAEAQGDGQWSVAFCTQHQPQRRLELMARLERGSGVWHGVIADVTERETLQQELRTQAETDALTRLPNRSMLLQRLQQCIHVGGAFALMFMDFDRFKQVNDSLGHEVGDELLRHIAQRLRHALRPTDALAARLGGDEFVVLAAGVPDGAAAQAMADRLLGILSRPYHVAGQEVVSSASIGIVLGDGRSSPAQLLRDADTAMYEAKRQGRGRWVQFSPDMHERVAGTVALEADLREALRLQQLRVVFQPIVEITSGRVTGLEALSRWHHPTRGEVSPARFIPLAEESGLINELGEHALRLACAAYMGWQRSGAVLPPRLSVNLSRAQLQDRGLPERVRAVLDSLGMPCAALQLEITESMAMQDDSVRQGLQALREMDIQLALDDFGTGHSSLAALHEFPVQQVKIDRSFVREIETSGYHRALVQAALQVAQALSLEVVAEGVETATQARLLAELGCPRAQGYLYAQPLEVDAVPAYLLAQQGRPAGPRRNVAATAAAHSRAHQMLVMDTRGHIIFVNAAVSLNTGFTLQELEGRLPSEVFHGPDTEAHAAAMLADAVRSGSGCMGVEIINYRKDGTPFWALVDIDPVRDDSGRIVQFIAVQTEITERRQERAELDALRNRIEAVQAVGLVGFWERDLGQRKSHIDANGRRMLGIAPGAALPSRADLNARVTPATRSAVDRYFEELAAGNASGRVEYSVRHDNGQVLDLQVLWSSDGQRVLGVMVDVTGTRQVRDQRLRRVPPGELAAAAADEV